MTIVSNKWAVSPLYVFGMVHKRSFANRPLKYADSYVKCTVYLHSPSSSSAAKHLNLVPGV